MLWEHKKKIATAIVDNNGDYILAVKGNQPKLENDITDYFNNVDLDELNSYEENDKNHGRIENRKYYISNDLNNISTKESWSNLTSIGMTISTRNIDGKISEQTKYYISSCKADIKTFSEATRQHWGIENSLHWCLDVGFNEDDCRIRKGFASENLAVVRHIALTMIKKENTSKRGVVGKRFNAAINNKYMEKVLNW